MAEPKEIDRAPIHCIVFDLEGTIVDLEPMHHEAHLKAAASVGVKLSWLEALAQLPHFIGGPDEEVAAEIAALANRNIMSGEIAKRKQAIFEGLLGDSARIVPREGFLEFFRWARFLHLGFAIGTSTKTIQARSILKRAGLLDIFAGMPIVAKEDVIASKPQPDIFLETARRLGIDARNQLVFEDSVIGIQAAYSARCRSVAVPTVHLAGFVDALFRAGAEAVFFSWSDRGIRQFLLNSIAP